MNTANPFIAPEQDEVVKAEQVDLGNVPYAGFWLRFVAAIVDGIIMMVIGLPIGFVIGMTMGDNPSLPIVANVFDIVIGWLYMALCESSRMQASPGKKLLGLKVTDEAGNKISFARASGRHFAKIISALILLIGYIMAGFTRRKQALHDILAGCLVVRAR